MRASLLEIVSFTLPFVSLSTFAPLAYAAENEAQQPLTGTFNKDACPNYAQYATVKHKPFSTGPLELPFQRPDPRCRTFHSEAIEQVIQDVTSRMKNPDLARLFENAFPSTTDTTVKFHTDGSKTSKMRIKESLWGRPQTEWDEGEWEGPQSFIITGDIIAEWLRDSTNQLAPYQPLAKRDPALRTLILGAINTQSEYVINSPYCNAFQPPPIAEDLPHSINGQEDNVHPTPDPDVVFECKYELDSLAHWLALGNDFYNHTGSTAFVNRRWLLALDTVMRVLEQQSRPTFDDTGRYRRNTYTFQRRTTVGTETLNLGGVGNPLAEGTGLVRSAFRPSDDACTFGFFIPANAMLAVELKRAAAVLRSANYGDMAERLDDESKRVSAGVWEHGVVKHRKYGDVFAYEVDGFGSAILMDDANYPSLLALPLMGFVDRDDQTYQNTRRMLLEKSSNPYFLKGPDFRGIGGPHIGLEHAWPMSLLIQAQTSDDDVEIMDCVNLVLKSARLGLVHESVNVNRIESYTRSWFAWANGVFAATILDLAKRKPHLIFSDATPYEV